MILLNNLKNELVSHFSPNDSVPVQDFGFEHGKFVNEKFRWAHYEYYTTDKVEIVHLVIMPHAKSTSPIFGFDVININGILTGMFFDLTPVDERVFKLPVIGDPRPRPEWSGFFSENFVCCKPKNLNEVMTVVPVLKSYLQGLPNLKTTDVSNKHQAYIDGQRKNPQTLKMLSAHIGKDKAEDYFFNHLWPDIK